MGRTDVPFLVLAVGPDWGVSVSVSSIMDVVVTGVVPHTSFTLSAFSPCSRIALALLCSPTGTHAAAPLS